MLTESIYNSNSIRPTSATVCVAEGWSAEERPWTRLGCWGGCGASRPLANHSLVSTQRGVGKQVIPALEGLSKDR